ncbi:MAG TPA: DNA glycosylase, partial [Armatimonadota bacterium]|nr:DNA glycosylase [Armatimonadota bacterium]
DSGQVFRWRREEDGRWYGALRGTALALAVRQDVLEIETAGAPIALAEIRAFLGLDDPLPRIREYFQREAVLSRAFADAYGMRIVQQDAWEGLVAFICSSHNAVFRIQQMMGALSRLYGEQLSLRGQTIYTFPPAERLAALTLENLAPCRLGYRDAYVLAAARMVAAGELNPAALVDAPDEEARAALLRVPGVGPKVADCIMLMALRKKERTFPIDVWVRRAVVKYYREAIEAATGVAVTDTGPSERQYRAIISWAERYFAPYTGYAQTYLFFAMRAGWI